MKAEARLHALADTVEEVGAETLYETLSNIKIPDATLGAA